MKAAGVALFFCFALIAGAAAQEASQDCGHMVVLPDGTAKPPSSVDPASVRSARIVVELFPIEDAFAQMSAQISAIVDRGITDPRFKADRAAAIRLKADLPAVLAMMHEDILETFATGIACHMPAADLDVVAGYMSSPAGQKFIAAEKAGETRPVLTDDETAATVAFYQSGAGKNFTSVMSRDSPTETWMNAEISRLGPEIIGRLKAKYEPAKRGGRR